jgi:hypothetical protein
MLFEPSIRRRMGTSRQVCYDQHSDCVQGTNRYKNLSCTTSFMCPISPKQKSLRVGHPVLWSGFELARIASGSPIDIEEFLDRPLDRVVLALAGVLENDLSVWSTMYCAGTHCSKPPSERLAIGTIKMTNTNSRSNARVGTMRKSTDAIPSAWLRRKVFHP